MNKTSINIIHSLSGFYDKCLFNEKEFNKNGFILKSGEKVSHEELSKLKEGEE